MNENINSPNITLQNEERKNYRTLGTTAGGALLGASLLGWPGALLGGLFGLLVGEAANKKEVNKKIEDV